MPAGDQQPAGAGLIGEKVQPHRHIRVEERAAASLQVLLEVVEDEHKAALGEHPGDELQPGHVVEIAAQQQGGNFLRRPVAR